MEQSTEMRALPRIDSLDDRPGTAIHAIHASTSPMGGQPQASSNDSSDARARSSFSSDGSSTTRQSRLSLPSLTEVLNQQQRQQPSPPKTHDIRYNLHTAPGPSKDQLDRAARPPTSHLPSILPHGNADGMPQPAASQPSAFHSGPPTTFPTSSASRPPQPPIQQSPSHPSHFNYSLSPSPYAPATHSAIPSQQAHPPPPPPPPSSSTYQSRQDPHALSSMPPPSSTPAQPPLYSQQPYRPGPTGKLLLPNPTNNLGNSQTEISNDRNPDTQKYSDSIKRHLDGYDLEQCLFEITKSGKQLLSFGDYHVQQAHQTPRSASFLDALPSLQQIETAMKESEVIAHNLTRLRAAAIDQQNAERARQVKLENSRQDVSTSGNVAGAPESKKRRGKAAPPGRCHSCNRAETPEWRRGPDGARTLCNACGLHYAKLTRRANSTGKPAIMNSSLLSKQAPLQQSPFAS